ncbi:hypothetical protein AYO44_06690 [Planctomycetaceae bacterium SCGC AG-212-F19]|nr:hypothetical protein AYO44_06690 [Planctomycetaceae bacterium SCGC AG-212-F19]
MDDHIQAGVPRPNPDDRLTTEDCLPYAPPNQSPSIAKGSSGCGKDKKAPVQSFVQGLVAVGLSSWILASAPIYLLMCNWTDDLTNKLVAWVLVLSKIAALYLVPGLVILRRFQHEDVEARNQRINWLATLNVAFDFGLFTFLMVVLTLPHH